MPPAKLLSMLQIVLPASIQQRLGLQPPDPGHPIPTQDRLIAQKAPASFVDRLDR